LLAIRQIDIKRFIAYTSISHMNFSIIGLFTGYEVGILGFIHTMISHGIIATALFFLIGHIYNITTYRDSLRLSGLSQIAPIFSIF
jgi:NADH-quinone oxidoreductase subunit M